MPTGRSVFTIAAVAGASLLLELVQTRILSALYFNHVVYLTVTVALLGFGTAGCLLSIRGAAAIDFDRALTWAIAAFALAALASPALASRTAQLLDAQGLRLGTCYLLLAVPFLCAGAVIGLLLMRHGERAHSLYAADLAASAGGALAFAYGLRPLGAEGLLWLVVALAIAALLVQAVAVRAARGTAFATVTIVVAVALVAHGRLVGSVPDERKVTSAAYEPGSAVRVESETWTPLAKIDVLYHPGGDFVTGRRTPGNQTRIITQDGSAHTALLGPEQVLPMLRDGPRGHIGGPALGYVLQPAARDALVIGVGGGSDVVQARALGARHIVGIEVNPATVDLVRGRYRELARWPDWPGVELIRAEGRQYARRTRQRFDVVVLSGVDTFAALSSGAYVLTENYLYTVEGVGDLLDLLRPNGVLVVYRWLLPQPRESLRLASLYAAAAEQRGIDPRIGIAVIGEDQGWKQWGATLMKRRPFTGEELAALARVVARQPAQQFVYVPPVLPAAERAAFERGLVRAPQMANARAAFAGLLGAPSASARRRFEAGYPYDVTPVTDARPFFFEYERVRLLQTFDARLDTIRGAAVYQSLLVLLLLTVSTSAVGTLLPLSLLARKGLVVPGAAVLAAFFAFLGLGFMLLEIGLMQRLSLFLGDPVRSITVVLAGLLLFTGVGSLLAGRARRAVPVVRAATAAAAVLAAIAPLILARLTAFAFTWPLAARIALALALLLPLGIALGTPFATGIRLLDRRAPQFIPWAWGINGLASVAGSVIAIVLAMQLGFDAALVLAGFCYGGAAIATGCLEAP